MRSAKGVIDVAVGKCRQMSGQVVIILRLTRMKPNILKEKDLTTPQLLCEAS
jgi:hypothetical protein